MPKALESKNDIFSTIIYENNGENGGERSQVACNKENERK